MDKWIVGKDFRETQENNPSLAYELLKAEITNIMGKYEIFGGFPPYEIIKDNAGIFYRRDTLYHDEEWETYYEVIGDNVPDDGAVMCQCFNKSFHIKYGNHECIAVCTQCKMEHVVYDG